MKVFLLVLHQITISKIVIKCASKSIYTVYVKCRDRLLMDSCLAGVFREGSVTQDLNCPSSADYLHPSPQLYLNLHSEGTVATQNI